MPDAAAKPKRRKVKPARSANEWVDVLYAGGAAAEPKRSRFGFGRGKGGDGTDAPAEAAPALQAQPSGPLPPLAAPALTGRGTSYTGGAAPRATVSREGDELLLREEHLPREEKLRLEGRYLEDRSRTVYEKGWVRSRSDTIDEIRAYVDSTLVRGAPPPGLSSRAHLRAGVSELPGRPLSGEAAALQIPGGESVVDRRVVYETRGGYVISVTRKVGNRTSTEYYTVSKVGDVEHALDSLRDVRSVSQTVDTLPAPRESPLRAREAAEPVQAPAAATPATAWREEPARVAPSSAPASAAPEPSTSSAPAASEPPASRGRFGSIASRLSLGRKKEAAPSEPTAAADPAPETGENPADEAKTGRFSALKGKLSFRRKRGDEPNEGTA